MRQYFFKIISFFLVGFFLANALKVSYCQPFYSEIAKQSNSSGEGKNSNAFLQLLFVDAEEILLKQTFKKKPDHLSGKASLNKLFYNTSFLFIDFQSCEGFSFKKGRQFLQLFLLFCSLKLDLTHCG